MTRETDSAVQKAFAAASREYALATEPGETNKWGQRCERVAAELRARQLPVPSLRFTLAGDEAHDGELRGY